MTVPERICNVSQTQFSIARYYGSATFKGQRYIYNPTTDELVRADILKTEEKAKKAAKPPKGSRAQWTHSQQSFAEFGDAQ